jgi:hypothetical protein
MFLLGLCPSRLLPVNRWDKSRVSEWLDSRMSYLFNTEKDTAVSTRMALPINHGLDTLVILGSLSVVRLTRPTSYQSL